MNRDRITRGDTPVFTTTDFYRIAGKYMKTLIFNTNLELTKKGLKNHETSKEMQKFVTLMELPNDRVLVYRPKEEMHIKYAFDGSQLFDVYGSSHEFLAEMKHFQDFTQSHKYFSTSSTSTYYTTPFIYFNESYERFIFKPDLFVILQYMTLLNVPFSKDRIICSLSSVLLKAYEDTLINASEFIRYDENEFVKIKNELMATKRTFIDEDGELQSDFYQKEILEKLEKDFKKLSTDEILEKLKKMIPFVLKEDEARSIHDWLEFEKKHDKEWPKRIIVTYTNTGFVMKTLQAVLRKRPEYFTFKKPKTEAEEKPEETAENSHPKEENSKKKGEKKSGEICENCVTSDEKSEDSDEKSDETEEKEKEKKEKKTRLCCRIFQDGYQRFVLKDELFLALGHTCNCKKGRSLKSLCSEFVQRMETIQLIPYDEVLKRHRKKIDEIQFITVPVLRTKHRAVPIPAPDYCKFYVLAVDALLEVLNSLIWETRVFQKFPVKHKKALYELFGELDMLIKQQSDPYMIEHKRLQEMMAMCDSKWDFHRKAPTNEVRKVSENGFTVQDVIEELNYLEITTFFPKIAQYAKKAYSEVNRLKKETVLRTCDMYDALELCQLYSVFEHFPKIKNFLHSQKSCRRVPGYGCDTCRDLWTGVRPALTEEMPWNLIAIESVPEDVRDTEAPPNTEINESEDVKTEESGDSEDSGEYENLEEEDATTTSESLYEPELTTTATQTDPSFENLEKSLEISEIEREKMEKKVSLYEKKLSEVKNSNSEIAEKQRREMRKKQEENEKMKQKLTTFEAIQKSNEKFERKIGRIGIDLHEKQKEITELRRELSTHTTTTRKNESKIEKLEKEIKKLREKPTVDPLIVQENEELKMRISNFEADEIRLQEAYTVVKNKFDEDRMEFSERITEMGRNLRMEKNKVADLEQQLCAQQDEIAEKSLHVRLYHDSNIQLKMENEANKKMIQEMMSRFAAPPPPMMNNNNTYSSGYGMNFESPRPLPPLFIAPRIAPIGSERAQRIAASASLQNSPSLPIFTPLSSQPSTPFGILEFPKIEINQELADSECLICLNEMMGHEKSIKCYECRRRFHFQCASDWLKVNSICPTCKGKLLNPDEFPAL